MHEEICFEAKQFLVNYLKGMKCENEHFHPWRNSWEFVVLHSFRVESYVKKILELEKHCLSEDEILLIRLASILHDIGRLPQKKDHALKGKVIVEDWIRNNTTISTLNINVVRLLELIEKHSNKREQDDNYLLSILKDADLLDEIGVMSIFMASSWIERDNPYFFDLLNQRVQDKEINFCDEVYHLLTTTGAKEILNRKKEFILKFSYQLQEENEGTADLGKITLEDY